MTQPTRDGVALQLDACATLAGQAAILRAQEQVFDLLARRVPVAITVDGLCGESRPEVLFVRLCKLLQTVLQDSAMPAAAISLVLRAEDLPPQFVWMVRSAILGQGPVYLLVDSQFSRPAIESCSRRRQERFWLQCWHLRNCGYVRTAFAPSITSPCPLFAAETATGILPPHGLQVPAGTAWAAARISITDYAGGNGELTEFALRERLHRCITTADGQHDEADWPTAAMRHDSWSNRRLAISITGLGDHAKARGMDPQSLTSLRDLEAIVQLIRNTVDDYSRELAAEKQHAPALDMAEDGAAMTGIGGLPAWRTRWQAALQFAATRHRNLLSISPWSVFPSGEPLDTRYCDLLPLLAHADACSFADVPSLKSLNINEFRYLHQRAGAVLEQKDAQQMIAEQV